MDIIKDMIYVNKTSGMKTLKNFKKNWYILFTGIVYTILNLMIFNIISRLFIGPLYILSGIVVAIISSSFISNYLYLLFNIINYDRITFQDFKDGFTFFLWKIYGVFFIGYIASLLLSLFGGTLGDITTLLYLGVLIALNALPETLYLKTYSPWESILKALEFIQENWLNWLIPNMIFLILLYMITGNILTNIFNTHLSFNVFSVFSIKEIIRYILGQILFSIMMMYRGNLYKILSTSTRRKRMFMNKF